MSELDELKRLLFGDEQRSLSELEHRVEDPGTRAEDVASVLAQSVRVSTAESNELSDALQAPVSAAIRASVRDDVDVFAESLFPVMGPAIRRSVLETFRAMVQTLNQTVESAFSWQGIKWRIESIRSGVAVSELILRDTLEYRVEQVLLVQRQSGLLIRYAALPDIETRDSDAVSAMLEAISSFVRDSFGDGGPGSGLDVVEIGGHVVWLLPGPQATLAVVFRGTPRLDLRARISEIHEQIQVQYGTQIAAFAGASDDPALQPLEAMLHECLAFQSSTVARAASPRAPFKTLAIVAAVIAAVLLAVFVWRWFVATERAELRAAIEAEPGIFLTEVRPADGRLRIRGLADPLARPVKEIAAERGFAANELSVELEPYQSADPRLLERRARQVLQAPASVTLAIAGARLALAGHADDGWIEGLDPRLFTAMGFDDVDLSALESTSQRLQRLLQVPDSVALDVLPDAVALYGEAPLEWLRALPQRAAAIGASIDTGGLTATAESVIAWWRETLQAPSSVTFELRDTTLILAGTAPVAWLDGLDAGLRPDPPWVTDFDSARLGSDERDELDRLVAAIDGTMLAFSRDTHLHDADAARLPALIAELNRMVDIATRLRLKPPQIEVLGVSDPSGAAGYNAALRERRAATVVALLRGALPAGADLSGRAASASENDEIGGAQRAVLLKVNVAGTAAD